MARVETDRELLGRYVKRGDVAAFERLVERHQATLLQLACGLVRDHHAAQDLVQEGFIVLTREARPVWKGARREGAIPAWLRRVVRHAAIDRLRAERRTVHATSEPPVRHVGADPDAGELLWRAVDELTPLQRAAVVLRYRDGMSYREIAESLDKSVGHVGVLLHQALARLREARALREEVLP